MPFRHLCGRQGYPRYLMGSWMSKGRDTDDVVAIGELFPSRNLSNQALFPAKPIYIVTSNQR